MDRAERSRTQLLVVDDDAAMRDFLSESLMDEGYRVDVAAGGRAGIERVRAGGVDLVVTDVKMPDMDGLDMLAEIRAPAGGDVNPPHVVVITAFGSIETAKRAVKLGAYDYITKPFEIDELLVAVEKALDERTLRREVARLRKEVARPYRFENIIGKSAPMQDVFALIRRLAGSSANVLITGESGTGKELVARALHFNSPRAKKAVRRGQLRRHPRHAARDASCSATSGAPSPTRAPTARAVRRGRRRHHLPRRDRRADAAAAGEAVARAAGARGAPARRGAARRRSTCASCRRPTAIWRSA